MNDFLKEAFTSEWVLKYLTELFATAFLVALAMVLLPTLSLQEQKVTNLLDCYRFWLWFWCYDASPYVW